MKTIALLFFVFFLLACKENSLTEIKKENEYYSFKTQTSPNEKYKIYSFCKSGVFSFNGDFCGTVILENGESFSETKGYKINDRINSWKNDTLLINRFDGELDQPKDTIVRISYEKYKNLNIKILNYGPMNASGMKEYNFDILTLNDQGICLKNIEKIMGEDIGKNKCYSLGSFEIVNTKDSLKEIIVESVIKSMNFTYRNPDGSYTKNLPEINVISLHFKPTIKTKPIDTKNLKGIFNSVQ